MRVARVRVDGKSSTAVIKGRTAHLVSGNVFGSLEPNGQTAALSKVEFLPPTSPSKIVAMALNYYSHAGARKPDVPMPFLKVPSSLVGHRGAIVQPPESQNLHPEAELVIVMGRRTSHITEEEVADHIFGYTCGNDVSERDWQRNDIQWWRAKSADTFSAVGPWIETTPPKKPFTVVGKINDHVQQEADSDDLIYTIEECISYISRFMTLERGDLVFLGTNGQTAAMNPGDVAHVEIQGVGTLSNPVVAGK
jgi:2-keto-4-pentenoate hydratase/2-oxohepta-3-ene-1,7-dioic acid hydratase in catechol pathway